jgi:adenine-specific DNA-methyltransferase
VQKIVQPAPEQSKDWDGTGNLLIKGDNLDALRLLRHSYFGKVKLIYIDPPYNTQSDAFIYRDDFSARQSDVLAQLGYSADNIDYIKNIYGARTHSGWLSFMYPRLLLAKDLLRDDGVIFISIDDNEQAQLKLLCDEVFGEENFSAQIVWQKKYGPANDTKGISTTHEYLLSYTRNSELWNPGIIERNKNQNSAFKNPDNDPRGVWRASDLSARTYSKSGDYSISGPTGLKFNPPASRAWIVNEKRYKELLADDRIFFGVNGTGRPMQKKFLSEVKEGITPETWWNRDKAGDNKIARYEIKSIFPDNIFETPKPTKLIQLIIKITGVDTDDTVLDFFAGSGTTGDAVMRLNAEDGGNRQFILVQIPQPIDPKKQKEAHRFVTDTLGRSEATIFEITAERLRRAGAKLQAERAAKTEAAGSLLPDDTPAMDTGFRVFELVDDPDALILQKPLADATQADVLALQTTIATPQPAHLPRILYNLLLAEGLPLTTQIEIVKENVLYRISDVLLVLQSLPLAELNDTVRGLQQTADPVRAITVYAPWVNDDNFILGIHTVAETLGFSEDKLRLRG